MNQQICGYNAGCTAKTSDGKCNNYLYKCIYLKRMKYQVIYADPPWRFGNKNTGGSMVSGAAAKYSTMSVKEICALPVNEIADKDCVLFMWWVGSMPLEALQVVAAWGFTVKTMSGFNWVKLTKGNKMDFGMGFWTRAGSEQCLIAVKGKPKRICASVRSVIQAPKEDHSKKPEVFRQEIVRLMGDVPRLEMFARQSTPGWDVFGNQVEGSISLQETQNPSDRGNLFYPG